ncbi:MAG: beta-lactamase family protein [Acidobacteria bacterium]|nr:beta-lactamase family protein [Acidobacteriota bacterium]
MTINLLKHFSASVLTVIFTVSLSMAQVPDKENVVKGAERAFEKVARTVTMPAPGCAVGVSLNGESVFEKAFGMAEMEHSIPNTPQTIFESGSVAKQFTAAALVLLQQDGKLNLDDPVKKYIPELPDYGSTLTIRHMLNHTAGLRDWFSVRALSGEGAGEHIITQQMIFDTVVRQKDLDFTPGSEYSYSNSGYQLAAMIVERVSKQKFPDFVAERIFKPVGMKNSSWRDDHRRVVPGRANAYSRDGNGPWRLTMPMMNAHGGGGMLTTVGDWIKWNAMLDSRSMGAPLVESLETQAVLNDGRKIAYALGLSVGSYKGNKNISHGGATAGYRTVLSRFPDKKLSIAVLCNGTSPNSNDLANSIADEILGPFPAPPATDADAEKFPIEQPEKYVGLWKNERTKTPNRFAITNGELRFNNTPVRAVKDGSLMVGAATLSFKYNDSGKPVFFEARNTNGDSSRYTAETEWQPTAADLAAFAGEWYSDDADAKITFASEGSDAILIFKPSTSVTLRPLYKDYFADQSGQLVWFERDESGKVVSMHIGGARMRNMPFVRIK